MLDDAKSVVQKTYETNQIASRWETNPPIIGGSSGASVLETRIPYVDNTSNSNHYSVGYRHVSLNFCFIYLILLFCKRHQNRDLIHCWFWLAEGNLENQLHYKSSGMCVLHPPRVWFHLSVVYCSPNAYQFDFHPGHEYLSLHFFYPIIRMQSIIKLRSLWNFIIQRRLNSAYNRTLCMYVCMYMYSYRQLFLCSH